MDIIKSRKSVRSYDGKPLVDEDIEKLSGCIAKADNPYDIPVEFRFLDPDKYELKSPVLTGETLYLAAKVKLVPGFEEAYGYSFEKVVLYAWSLGIGTVWIGGTMNRENFEKAMELTEDEVMPCVTPVGYPAKKKSVRETLMRKGIKADSRYDISQIAFEEEEGRPLSGKSLELYKNAFEMVRWAPSAVNKQPWRMVVKGDTVHFYKKPDKGFAGKTAWDLQKIDVGIAMYHFEYGMNAAGKKVSLVLEDPGINVPGNWQYSASYKLI